MEDGCILNTPDARTIGLAELRQRLSQVPDPIAFLESAFAFAPIAFQIYQADGHCLVTNRAFLELFGAVPPPEYSVLEDDIARREGVLDQIHRAFAGETVHIPPVWYDPRELTQVRMAQGRRVGISSTFFPLFDGAGKVAHVGIVFQDVTQELEAREAAEAGRRAAEAGRQRFEFLARASELLASSLDFLGNLRRIAELSVPAIADWTTVTAIDEAGVHRRLAVVHRDPAKAALCRLYERDFPPGAHRAGEHGTVFGGNQSVLLPEVSEALLVQSAQSPEHLALLRGLGVRSCLMVPIRFRGAAAGVISLMFSEGPRRFTGEDLALAEEISRRASMAMETARLYREEQRARQEAETARRRLTLLDELTREMVADLPQAARPVEALAKILVPRLADWCTVFAARPDGSLEVLAAANANPQAAREAFDRLVHTPLDPKMPWGAPRAVRTGQVELVPQVGEAHRDQLTVDPEYRQKLRAAGLCSFLAVPLKVHGRVVGCLAFSHAESGRHFSADDVPLVEELGVRAALLLEQGRLFVEAQAARNEAEEANRAKDEFLAMLGHELRNPIAPIATSVELMKLRGDPRSAREHEVIERQVQHLTRLVDDLLDVSRVARGKVALHRVRLEVSEFVAKGLEMASPLIEQRGHALRVEIPRVGLPVSGDEFRLAQVMANLLTNAARYTEPNGRIELTAAREGSEVVVRVRDSGIGIDPELLPKVFELFVQGRQTRGHGVGGGLGLGLALVRRLVELHGGQVGASSEGTGRGSEFVVRLPALEVQPQPAPKAAEEAAGAREADPSGRRILLVDDNRDGAFVLAECLRTDGHRVEVAHDAEEALEKLRAFSPEVAVLDIGLPRVDGYQLAHRIQQACARPPLLLALTGYGQEHDHSRSRQAGFHTHLVKPVDLNRLMKLVRAAP